MAKYKIAYSGMNTVTVEADSAEAAKETFWEAGMNDLYNTEIEEVVAADEPFKQHTDLNE